MISARTRLRALTFLLPVMLVASAGCDIAMADHNAKASDVWRKTYELQPGGRVEIGNVNGKVQVTRGTGNTVDVVATKTARGASPEAAKENLGRVEIRESTEGGAIKLETHIERAAGIFNNGGGAVEYVVRVPEYAEVKATTVNGGVEVSGISGRVIAETTNGGIKARDISGAIEATTTNGGVDVDVTKITDAGVKLECTNGGIELRLPADAKASISARVTNGGISADGLQLTTRGETTRRRMDGDLNGGGPRVSLEGTNGGIRIRSR